MIQFPILNHGYQSCYSANSYIPESQFGGRDVKVLLDRLAQDGKTENKDIKTLLDRMAEKNQHSFNLMKIVSLVFIAAVIINRSGCLIENGKLNTTDPVLPVILPVVTIPTSIKIPLPITTPIPIIIPPPITTPIPDPTLILPEPEVIIPCTANITAYRVILKGRCSDEEIDAAYAEKDRLSAQREKDLETKGRRMADESNKYWGESIEKSKKNLEETIRRNAQTEDTPEAIAESLKAERETACKMHQNMGHLPGFSYLYKPVCVKNEIELLGADMSDNCTTIKKLYRKKSVRAHPDHNDAPDANTKFNEIAKAYKKICP